jgi:hypothetical protein
VAPSRTFVPQQGTTGISIDNALLQGKIVAPPANTPIAEVVSDLSSVVPDDQNRLLVEKKLTIEAGTHAQVILRPTVTQGKVVAGFLRIFGNWTYLGVKPLNQDGTATFDGMAFTLPTQLGDEYVILLAVVDSNYTFSSFISAPQANRFSTRLESSIPLNSYFSSGISDSTVVSDQQIKVVVEVLGTAPPMLTPQTTTPNPTPAINTLPYILTSFKI